MTENVQYTVDDLEYKLVEVHRAWEKTVDPEQKSLLAKDINVLKDVLQAEYDKVSPYEDVVPEQVREFEKAQFMMNPAASQGTMLAQGLQEFGRWLGLGEYGQTKSVEGVEGEVTRAQEIGYGFSRGSNMIGRYLLTAQAYAPSGGTFLNPETGVRETESAEQRYDRLLGGVMTGAEFLALEPEQREDVLIANKQRIAREDWSQVADVLEVAGEDETARAIGNTLSELTDPSILALTVATKGGALPIIASGAGYSLSHEASQQLHEDELNTEQLLESAVLGGVATAAFMPIQSARLLYRGGVRTPAKVAEKGIKKVNNQIQNLRATKGSEKAASAISEKLQNRTAWHWFNTKHPNGRAISNTQAQKLAEKDLGLTPKNKKDVLAFAENKPKRMTKEEAAKRIELMDNPIASTSAIGRKWDIYGAPMVQALKNIDQKLGGAVRNHDMRMHVALATSLQKVEPTFKIMRQSKKTKNPVTAKAYQDMEFALLNQQWVKASRLQRKHFPELEGQFKNLKTTLDDIHKRATDVGIKMPYLINYMPRYIKDIDGLRAAVGKKHTSLIDDVMDKEAKKAGVEHWAEVDEEVLADAITNAIIRVESGVGKTKRLESGRTIRQIPERLRPYYHDVATSTQLYINKAEREIAKHEFFGKTKAFNKNGKIDLDASINQTIGKHVLDMRKQGKVFTREQEGDLRLLMKARFEAADKAMSKTFATARDLQYAVLLGQFDAALIQLGDIGSSLYLNGVANTAKAMITRNKNAKLTVDDLGLVNQVSAEMSNLSGMVKFLDTTLTYSGFKAIDRLGKNTFIKAAWLKNTKLARTNPKALEKKYGKVYENEIGDMIADLQAGRLTDNTKLLIWNELADVQPIALSEMPRKYLEMENGRILYSLKSFGLKQLGLIRQNIIDKARKGNLAEAMEEALRYSMLVGFSGGTVENARTLLRTGDTNALMDIDDAAMENLFKIFFMGKYSREKYLQEGQFGSFAVQSMLPAVPSLVDRSGAFITSVLDEQENDPEAFNDVMRMIPVAGSAYYHMAGGGAEKIIERAEKERLEEE